MNAQITRQYAEYLAHTGDKTVAGCLVLAAIMLEGRSESSTAPAGALLTV